MILLVSSSAHERTALATLLEHQGWVAITTDSLWGARRLLPRSRPRAIVIRHVLADGYSDELLAEVAAGSATESPRFIVLCAAGTAPRTQARQVALGADCVLHDPVRTEVLLAHLARYLADPWSGRPASAASVPTTLTFAGATLHLTDRTLQLAGRDVTLTPREAQLIELLVRCAGQVVTYEMLFSEILGRPYRGDTSNLRVLLGKLVGSTRRIGIDTRAWVEVIAKSGYRYRGTPALAGTSAGTAPSSSRRRA